MLEKIFTGAAIACGLLVIGFYLLMEASRPPSPPGDPRDIPIAASSIPTPAPADQDTRTRTPVSGPLSPPQELATPTVKAATEPPAVESPAPVGPVVKETARPVRETARPKVKETPSPKVSISEERLARAKRQLARVEELRRVRHFYEWQWRPVESAPTADEAPAPPATPAPVVRSGDQTDDAGRVVD
jgi:hypothetical protein